VPRLAVVVVTRNRSGEIGRTLSALRALPERPRVVVVDNGSSDGTPASVRARHPDVEVIELGENLGCGGRTVGVRHVSEPYVAFSDDDSWWAPGSLARAAELFDRHPRLAVVAARVLVGADGRLDPVCAAMAASPLPADGLPGPAVLGFVACGAVVRRDAFLEVGGFDGRFGIGGEEELLALDLAAAGWALSYVDAVVACHDPSPARDPAGRRRVQARNALWAAWLRRPAAAAVRRSAGVLASGATDPAAWRGAVDAARGLPWVLRERRPVPGELAAALRSVESGASDVDR
jgi:GT2 family glycosyltransferase